MLTTQPQTTLEAKLDFNTPMDEKTINVPDQNGKTPLARALEKYNEYCIADNKVEAEKVFDHITQLLFHMADINHESVKKIEIQSSKDICNFNGLRVTLLAENEKPIARTPDSRAQLIADFFRKKQNFLKAEFWYRQSLIGHHPHGWWNYQVIYFDQKFEMSRIYHLQKAYLVYHKRSLQADRKQVIDALEKYREPPFSTVAQLTLAKLYLAEDQTYRGEFAYPSSFNKSYRYKQKVTASKVPDEAAFFLCSFNNRRLVRASYSSPNQPEFNPLWEEWSRLQKEASAPKGNSYTFPSINVLNTIMQSSAAALQCMTFLACTEPFDAQLLATYYLSNASALRPAPEVQKECEERLKKHAQFMEGLKALYGLAPTFDESKSNPENAISIFEKLQQENDGADPSYTESVRMRLAASYIAAIKKLMPEVSMQHVRKLIPLYKDLIHTQDYSYFLEILDQINYLRLILPNYPAEKDQLLALRNILMYIQWHAQLEQGTIKSNFENACKALQDYMKQKEAKDSSNAPDPFLQDYINKKFGVRIQSWIQAGNCSFRDILDFIDQVFAEKDKLYRQLIQNIPRILESALIKKLEEFKTKLSTEDTQSEKNVENLVVCLFHLYDKILKAENPGLVPNSEVYLEVRNKMAKLLRDNLPLAYKYKSIFSCNYDLYKDYLKKLPFTKKTEEEENAIAVLNALIEGKKLPEFKTAEEVKTTPAESLAPKEATQSPETNNSAPAETAKPATAEKPAALPATEQKQTPPPNSTLFLAESKKPVLQPYDVNVLHGLKAFILQYGTTAKTISELDKELSAKSDSPYAAYLMALMMQNTAKRSAEDESNVTIAHATFTEQVNEAHPIAIWCQQRLIPEFIRLEKAGLATPIADVALQLIDEELGSPDLLHRDVKHMSVERFNEYWKKAQPKITPESKAFEQLKALEQKDAKELNGFQCYVLAKLYNKELTLPGFESNPAKAFHYYLKSAEKGCINGNREMARAYKDGLYDQPKNPALALEHLTKACNAGDTFALNLLGEAYYYGNLGHEVNKENKQKGAELWKQAVGLGHAYACGNLGQYYHEESDPIDIETAIFYLIIGAERNDLNSCNRLGYILNDKKNPECVVYYKRATEINNKDGIAYFNFGLLMQFGLVDNQEQTVIAKDIPKAIELFEQAAKNGTYTAHLNLGIIYKDQKEEAKSREHFQKAAIHFRAGFLKDPSNIKPNRFEVLKNQLPDDIEILYYVSTAKNQNLLAEKKLSAEDTKKIRVLFEEDMSSDNEAIRKNATALIDQLDPAFAAGQDLDAIRLLRKEYTKLEELKKEKTANTNPDNIEKMIFELYELYLKMLDQGVAENKVREKIGKLLTKDHMELARKKSTRSKLGATSHFDQYESYFRSVVDKCGSLTPEEAEAYGDDYVQTQTAQSAAEVKSTVTNEGEVKAAPIDSQLASRTAPDSTVVVLQALPRVRSKEEPVTTNYDEDISATADQVSRMLRSSCDPTVTLVNLPIQDEEAAIRLSMLTRF